MTGKLFDADHRAQMEKNGEKLRENLRATVAKGRQPGLMGGIAFNFASNLLHDLETRKVVKEKAGSVKRNS